MFNTGFPKNWSTLRKLMFLHALGREVISTLTGAVVSFIGKASTEILGLTAAVTPVQDLHGYANPWPAGGGKNKMPILTAATTVSGVTATPTSDGGIALSGKASATTYIDLDTSFDSTAYAGYLFSGLPDTGTWNASSVCYRISSADSRSAIQDFYRSDGTYHYQAVIDNGSGLRFAIRVQGNYQIPEDFVIYPMLRAADISDTFEPYANICPIAGFTGANIYVSPTQNQGDATTYTFDWTSAAGTVYGGTLDAVTGKLKARPQYASYSGQTLVGPWLSSMDAYAAGATPTTGAQVVDLGGTETEYILTPQQVAALVGQNYIWADTGDVTVTVKNAA